MGNMRVGFWPVSHTQQAIQAHYLVVFKMVGISLFYESPQTFEEKNCSLINDEDYRYGSFIPTSIFKYIWQSDRYCRQTHVS